MLTRPLIVQYLYVHGLEEGFHYPSARSTASVGSVAVRYLECALSQVASLRLKDTPCDLVLATNAGETSPIGRSGRELLGAIEALGVQILPTEYRHRPSADVQTYVASRYVLDAILSATEGEPPLTARSAACTSPTLPTGMRSGSGSSR